MKLIYIIQQCPSNKDWYIMVLANWAVSATAGFILGLLFDNFRDAKQFLRLVDKIPNRFKYKPVMKVKHKIKWLMKFGNWKPKD